MKVYELMTELSRYEAGLEVCSWAHNEEMVDWLAIQFPKLYEAFLQADCI